MLTILKLAYQWKTTELPVAGFLLTGLESLSDDISFLLMTPADAAAATDSLEAALIAAGPG